MQKNEVKLLTIVLWSTIVVLTAAVFFVTNYFHFSAPLVASFWVGWACIALTCAAFTIQGKQIIAFAKESRIELQKVVWPSRHETIQTTSIVMVMVTLAGFVLWGIDSGMMWVIGKLTNLG